MELKNTQLGSAPQVLYGGPQMSSAKGPGARVVPGIWAKEWKGIEFGSPVGKAGDETQNQACGNMGEWGTQKACTAIASSWDMLRACQSVPAQSTVPASDPFWGLGRRERRAPGRGESPPCTSPALEDSVWCFQSRSGGIGG